jgi:hypothetical protein
MAFKADIGDQVRLTVNIQVDEADADPSTLLLKWKPPKTAATIYTHGADGSPTVKDSVGNYHADIDIAVQGLHYYRWECRDCTIIVGKQRGEWLGQRKAR